MRSNYLLPDSIRFYEHSMRLWENLSHDLNYNVMFSQRGILNLAHTPAQADDYIRRGNAMRHGGGDADWLTPDQIGRKVPGLDVSARRASRWSAACCSPRPARRATTPSPGAMRAARTGAASTSSRIAR